ncbi:hypothetical protein [Microvirga sp. M2]|uniref:hypothetical protein n=1 Tax=Microvirga sp. M2 TaxID=3073270 RepID=UPI0039C3750C
MDGYGGRAQAVLDGDGSAVIGEHVFEPAIDYRTFIHIAASEKYALGRASCHHAPGQLLDRSLVVLAVDAGFHEAPRAVA